MEIHQNISSTNSPLMVNEEEKGFLLETSKWANFLAILGFIGVGFMVLAALFMGSLGSLGGRFSDFSIVFVLMYLIIAALYFFPIYYLFQFSSKMKDAILANDQPSFSLALGNLKSHYKFIGIFVIVIISLYLLIFIVSLSAISRF